MSQQQKPVKPSDKMAANKNPAAWLKRPKLKLLRLIFLLKVEVLVPLEVDTWKTSSMWLFCPMPKSIGSSMKFEERRLDSNTLATKKGELFTTDPNWSTYRDNLRAVGGHTFAAFLGCSPYQSASMAFKKYKGFVKKEEPNHFSREAMAHGKTYEVHAVEITKYLNRIMPCDVVPAKTSLYSVLFEKEGVCLDVAVTPDLLAEGTIYEFKCPWYQRGLHQCPKEWADAWTLKTGTPFGKTEYWAQALLYSIFEGDDSEFIVAVNFVTEEERMMVRYWSFNVTDTARNLVMQTLKEIALCQDSKELTRSKKYRNMVYMIALDGFIQTWDSPVYLLTIDNKLHEESHEDSGQDTDDVPWE